MTIEDVESGLERIRAAAAEDEDSAAHGYEDQLWVDVLTAISLGECEDPGACARLALTSNAIKFSRWYA